jgi:4-azaleucine resistance transporter AzlC
MCDESFAINYTAEVPAGIDKGWFLLWISLLNYSYWVTGSFLGSQFSTLLQFNLKGLGFIMTTLFAVIFLEQWLKEDQHVSASVGFAASLGCLAVFGAQRFMIPALVIILAVLTILRKPLQRQGGRGQF